MNACEYRISDDRNRWLHTCWCLKDVRTTDAKAAYGAGFEVGSLRWRRWVPGDDMLPCCPCLENSGA